MEAKERRNEWILILLPVLPLIYFLLVWNSLPENIPVHYGIDMKPNGYQSRLSLFISMTAFLGGFYLLFRYIHLLDPKKKLKENSKVLKILRFVMAFLSTAVCMLLLIMAQQMVSARNGNALVIFTVAATFIILGNYLPVVKQNYFIGIRTPWTLQNESVWVKTHRVGGRLFVIAGVILGLSLFFSPEITFGILIGEVAAIAVFSFVYSYLEFRKQTS